MEQPFKRRKVSRRVEQTWRETNLDGLRPKWKNYDREKESNRGREQPRPKGTPSGAFDGTNLPLNPFEPPHKALYPRNEIQPVLHPRNLTQRQNFVSPKSTAVASVVQVDVQSGDGSVANVYVPAGSSVVSLSGHALLTLSDSPAIPSSSTSIPPYTRAASSAAPPQSTLTSAASSQAVPSSTPPVSASPSSSALRPTKSQDYAANTVTSSRATATPMTINLQRLSSQEVLSPSPSSPLPPSPASSLSSSSASASFFPSSAGTSSQSTATQTPSSSEPQPSPKSSSLSATRGENLSLSAFLSANARTTHTKTTAASTESSSSKPRRTISTDSQSSRIHSGTPSTLSTTTTTSTTLTASRTSASSSRSKSSLSSSRHRSSTSSLTSSSKPSSTSNSSTSPPSSLTTSSVSQPSETLALSPTITSGETTGGAGGSGGAGGTGNGASASSTATPGAVAGSGGGGLTPATRAVVGGVVGGLAGLSIIFLILLLLIRWRRNKARLQRPIFSPLPQTIPPGEAGQGSSMTERSSAVPLAAGGFFKRLRPHSGQTAATTDTGPSERGFQNFGGRKLESVLSSRGDGYGEPGPSLAAGPAIGFGSTPSVGRGQGFGHSPGPSEPDTLSGSSFYRDSQGFYGGKEIELGSGPSSLNIGPGSPPRSSPTNPPPPAGGLPSEGVGGTGRATSEIPVMRPGPARTPVTNQPGFVPMRNPPRPPRSTPSPRPPRGTPSRTGPVGTSPVPRPPDELGRSHPSFDGSRGSRFTEEV